MTTRSWCLPVARRLTVAGATLISLACGGETALTHRNGGDGNGGMRDADGGVSGSGASGSAGEGGGAGNGAAGSAGASAGAGGSSARGGMDGGTTAVAGGSANGSGGTAGSNADASADPHAMERAALVSNFCALLDQYPCLTYPSPTLSTLPSTRSAEIAFCNQDAQIASFNTWKDACFDEWTRAMQCLTSLPRMCPCTGNDCNLVLPGERPSPCPSEEAALDACMSKVNHPSYTTTGSAGTCLWQLDENNKCYVQCGEGSLTASKNDLLVFTADCNGPPNGPEACSCSVNGVPLHEGTFDDPTFGASFYATDCGDVSQKLSDGQCKNILNCCFTWFAVPGSGQPPVEQCSCLSDPMIKGLSSCDAVAAQGGGKVVDICPQYLFPSGFPH